MITGVTAALKPAEGELCNGDCTAGGVFASITGTITVSVNFDLQYSVDNIVPYVTIATIIATTSSAQFTGLCAGYYKVIAHNIPDGTATSNIIQLTEPAVLVGVVDGTNILCNNGCTGTLFVDTTGGVQPYIYLWTGPNGYSSSGTSSLSGNSHNEIIGLCAGSYDLLVTDANGCTQTYPSNFLVNPAPIVDHGLVSAKLCYGATTGEIQVAPTGGTGPYTYLWSNGETTSTISNLPAGNYTVVITDTNSCSKSFSYILEQTNQIIITGIISNPSGSGKTDGGVQIQVSGGGSGIYTYLWDNGQTTGNLIDVAEGTYTITVTDGSCTADKSFILIDSCPRFSYSEFKVFLIRAQCCFGEKVKIQNSLVRQGRQDLADKMDKDLRTLNMIIQRFYCLDSIANDICWECEDLDNLMTLAKRICECDCCSEDGKQLVRVQWNEETQMFDIINQ